MVDHRTPGVFIEELSLGPKGINGDQTTTAAFIGTSLKGPLMVPTIVGSWVEFHSIFGGPSGPGSFLSASVELFFRNGGARAYIVRIANDADPTTALDVLLKVEDARIVAAPGYTSVAFQQALLDHCKAKGDRFAILDPAHGEGLSGISFVIQQRSKLRSDQGFGALYFPWLRANEPAFGTVVTIPPSGAMAGLYVRNDIQRGVYKAPANMAVTGIVAPEVAITAQELEQFNSRGINTIRSMPGRGIMVWGARTVSDDPEWKYVNLRRYLTYLERSLSQGTQWAAFERNDVKLWSKLTVLANDFLTKEWIDGGLMGTKPEQAFIVKCDRTSMTQKDIDDGRVVLLLGVAPVKPAEFIMFRIAQKTS